MKKVQSYIKGYFLLLSSFSDKERPKIMLAGIGILYGLAVMAAILLIFFSEIITGVSIVSPFLFLTSRVEVIYIAQGVTLIFFLVRYQIEKKYITHCRNDQPKDGEQIYKIVILSDGRILKAGPKTPVWGRGEEYTFSLPSEWKDCKNASNDLLYLIPIKYNKSFYVVRLVLELQLKKEFSPVRLLKIVRGQKPMPLLSQRDSSRHADVALYLKKLITPYIYKVAPDCERVLARALKTGEKKTELINTITALVKTVLPRRIFNVRSIKVSPKKSLEQRIEFMSILDVEEMVISRVA